jgi:hypothetical protein
MAIEEILITVKTYPVPSEKYDELVCTAGLKRNGDWVRLYPVPFRKLEYEKQYKKYQWIRLEIERNHSDPRPETYRLKNHQSIQFVGEVPTDKNGTWEARRKLLLKNVYSDKNKLIEDAHNPSKRTSLAVFKPKKIIGFKIEGDDREWNKQKIDAINAKKLQTDLFLGQNKLYDVVNKLPYTFSYKILDENDRESTLQIIDWEIGALYWNCFRKHKGDERLACEDVRRKYWDDFVCTKDVYLVLGTTKEYHIRKAKNPFLIISVFPPKPKLQGNVFD